MLANVRLDLMMQNYFHKTSLFVQTLCQKFEVMNERVHCMEICDKLFV